MYLNNKGSILVTTLIIFSIIATIVMTCIGLNYTNSNIFTLELKESKIKQIGYGAIDIVHGKILKEVEEALKNLSTEDDFNKHFLGNTFKESICDISYGDLKNVSISIPNAISVDNKNKCLKFDINAKVKDKIYYKAFKASVKIINPYYDIDNNINYSPQDNISTELSSSCIVKVYNYKEIYMKREGM